MHETRGNHLEPDLYSVRAAVIEYNDGGGDKETARAGGHDGGRDGRRQRADARARLARSTRRVAAARAPAMTYFATSGGGAIGFS